MDWPGAGSKPRDQEVTCSQLVLKGEVQADLAGDLKLGLGDQPVVLKTGFKNKLELEAR